MKILLILLLNFLLIVSTFGYNTTNKDKIIIEKLEIKLDKIVKNNKISVTKLIQILQNFKLRKNFKNNNRVYFIIDELIKYLQEKNNGKKILKFPKNTKFIERETDLTIKRPEYLKYSFDEIFNIKIIRITDINYFKKQGLFSKNQEKNTELPPYPKTQAWNSDGKFLRLNNFLLDGESYKFIKNIGGHSFERKWSHIRPNIIFGMSFSYDNSGKKIAINFVEQDIKTLKFKTLYTFSLEKYYMVYMGPWEGNISFDDKKVVFVGKKGNDFDLILFDIENKKILKTKTFKNFFDKLDWASISPLGKYILINNKNGIFQYDLDFNLIRKISEQSSHGDIGVGFDNNEVYVQFEFGSRAGIWMYDLENGKQLKILPSKYNGGHISCRNYKQVGWCYLSAVKKGFREIVGVKLDNTETVRRFGQTHQKDGFSSYGSPNSEGTKVIFKSFWGTGIEESFVSEVK